MSGPRERLAQWLFDLARVLDAVPDGPPTQTLDEWLATNPQGVRVTKPELTATTGDGVIENLTPFFDVLPDALADTTLRDQIGDAILNALCDSPVWENRHIGELEVHIADGIAEALLPLLRAHDAQVWDEGERAGHTNANPYRHLIRNPYRDRAEQDTPDQANT